MRLVSLLTIIFVLIQPVFSESPRDNVYEVQGYEFEGFYKDVKAYLYADRVNLRAEPSLNSKTVTELPITQEITILSKSSKKLNLNGDENYWYQIKTVDPKTEKRVEGFVWGALLSLLAFPANLDDDLEKEWILVNLEKTARDSSESKVYEIKIVDEGKLIISKKFTLQDSMMGSLMDGKLVNKVNEFKLISLGFSANMCSTINGGNVFFTFKNDELNYGFTTMLGSDSGVFYRENEIRYPNDKGGRKNHIIVNTVIKELNNNEQWSNTVLSVQFYKWNCDRLVKVNR